MVDGEDWDLFSVMSGHYGPYARDKYGVRITKEEKEKADRKQKEKFGLVNSKTPKAPPVDEDMRNIGELIDEGLFEEASDEFWAIWPVRKKMSHSLFEEFRDTASKEDASHQRGPLRHRVQFASCELF